MNIFATYACPIRSARSLDDQRLIKLCLESCQLLATAAYKRGRWQCGMPKPTHQNHPLPNWVAAYRQNFEWLWEHVLTLDKERMQRFGSKTPHKTLVACHETKLFEVVKHLPLGWSPHPNCARNRSLNIDFTHIKDVHRAYRLYLNARWLLQARPAICTIKGLLEQENANSV